MLAHAPQLPLRASLFDRFRQMRFPHPKRIAHLIEVLEAIVHAGHAAKRAGDVVQDALYDVRRDTKLCEMRRDRPPEVVQRPFLHSCQSVELQFSPREMRKDRILSACREHIVACEVG